MRGFIFIFIASLLVGCDAKQHVEENQSQADTAAAEVTSEDAYVKKDSDFDWLEFYGVFDHESTTNGFSAVLSLKQNGRDLYFTISIAQGSCKKETEGVVMIVESTEEFPTGFYQSDNCRLQFTFAKADKKVDIKEVPFCGIDGCSFEGTYKKRVN